MIHSLPYKLSKKVSLTVLVATLCFSLVPQQVWAIDVMFNSGNKIDFIGDDPTCDVGAGTITSGSDVEGSSDAEKNVQPILEYFTAKGMTLAGASGIVGNMKTESGYEPAIIQGGAMAPAAQKNRDDGTIIFSTVYMPVNEVGFGLSQWTYGGTTSSRQGGLYKLAQTQKKDIIDLGLQLDYVWIELTTSYKTSTLDRIKNMTDPREATKIYMVNYEGPKDQSEAAQNKRADDGEAIYNKYKSIISDGASTDSAPVTDEGDFNLTCGSDDQSVGGVGVADGFTFPLKTTKADIQKGADGSVWCSTKTTNCHHDYNAADIFAETGTPIIAAAPGKVVGKTTDSCDFYGCNVSIIGDDGILYYYTHMSKQATVNIGQKIQAGQEIGSVGTNATAMDTPRHLHFDMLPGDKYPYRPGCSSAACTAYPFINVQAYLVPAFQQLP
jgi:murein DD-endopeptidase MepM/ murein hydrolase activator NlpD